MILGFGGVVVLVGGLSAWSVFASISGAVIASGRVVVENRNQVVEHIDGGTVSGIPVRAGAAVARDEVLLRFSAFPARVTRELDGHVRRVSADALRDLEAGKSWYEVELALGTPPGGPATGEGGTLRTAKAPCTNSRSPRECRWRSMFGPRNVR